MRAKGRYVVVGRLNHRVIKDFYMLPVGGHVDPPDMLLPFDGTGYLAPTGFRRNQILCILVTYQDDAPGPMPVPPPQSGKQYSLLLLDVVTN